MRPRESFTPAVAIVVLFLFCFLLIRVLLLRYERGDIYPPFSTLRVDPMGTRALYEALGATGRFEVERGFVSTRQELADHPATVFYLGSSTDDFGSDSISDTDRDALDTYLRKGGRIVITFQAEKARAPASPKKLKTSPKPGDKKTAPTPEPAPQDKPSSATPQTQQEKYEREEFRKEQDKETEAEKRELSSDYHPSLAALWGFGWDRQRSSSSGASDAIALPVSGAGQQEKVPWESALYFVRLEPDWTVEYKAMDKPVLIRRAWGKGEIIAATDSYFLSNEALRDDRRIDLLSFIAGPPGRLLFDEVHLGTEEQEGIMVLAQHYRLEGFLYGLLVVAGLFLWRQSIPLVPPREVASGSVLGGAVSGKDSRSGLINLLRRNIPASELLRTCLKEWKRGITPNRGHLHKKADEMEALLAASETEPTDQLVQTYQHLREVNAPSRVKGNYATKS